jgi:hypothetical protein
MWAIALNDANIPRGKVCEIANCAGQFAAEEQTEGQTNLTRRHRP